MPRLGTGRDPIREKLGQLAASGGLRQDGIEAMVKAHGAKFGLDKPLYMRASTFSETFTLDTVLLPTNYPARVGQMIGNAIPLDHRSDGGFRPDWICSGALIGALSAWPNAPPWMRSLAVPFMTLSAIPPTCWG